MTLGLARLLSGQTAVIVAPSTENSLSTGTNSPRATNGGALFPIFPLGFSGAKEAAQRGVTVSATQVRSSGAQLATLGELLNAGTIRVTVPTFRQRTNGDWDDRTAFLARITDLRNVVSHATITVLDELADGERYSERHVIDLLMRDGERIVQEVYLFAKRQADGRFNQIEEATVMLKQ